MAKKAGIQKVQVHESVADRIFNHVVDYGPANMISDFDVVDDHGQLTTQNHCSLKRFEQKKSEKTVQQGDHKISLFQFALTRVADIAWWRRALHVGTIISLIAFTVFPWLPWVSKEPVNCTGFFSCLLEPLLGALLVISAGAAKPWTIALSAHPAYFVGFVGVFAFLVVAHLYLRSMMIEASLQAWKVVTGKKSTDIKKNLFHAIAYHLRRHRISKIIAKGASKWVIPGAFVTLFLLGIAWVSGSLVVSSWTAFGFHQPGCETRSQDQAIIDANNANSASNHCIITGYRILKEQSYLIRIQATNDWVDKTIPASQPSGFTSSKGGAIMHLFAPFRRHVDQPWFQLMAKVGDEGEPFAIDAMDHPFTADASGNLIVYVNDAYCPGCPDPWSFYKNNQGQIIPTVLDEKGEELIKKLK